MLIEVRRDIVIVDGAEFSRGVLIDPLSRRGKERGPDILDLCETDLLDEEIYIENRSGRTLVVRGKDERSERLKAKDGLYVLKGVVSRENRYIVKELE